MTDVDVALDGQGKGQPDGCRVEVLRYDLVHDAVGVAGGQMLQRFAIVAERVEVAEPRRREDQRQHIGQGHGH